MTSDFWVIAAYFNPARYKTKRQNFDRFLAGMTAVGANLLVVELAFGDGEFELDPGEHVLQLRARDVMWQKERLLNVAAAHLPASCRKVGWFDADILFMESDWLERTCAALDHAVVVQPFSYMVRLNRDNRDDGSAPSVESFAVRFVRDPQLARFGNYLQHGHTGYAWAARRELFEQCGLYDVCLTGSNDHLMAHAFTATIATSPCMVDVLGAPRPDAQHFIKWGLRARDLVAGKVGVVPGRILHLWHGEHADRRYAQLDAEFRTLGFDPDRHVRHDENGLLQWTAAAPGPIREWARGMFETRDEDGDRPAAAASEPPQPRDPASPATVGGDIDPV